MEIQQQQYWTLNEWFFENGGLYNGILLIVALTVVGFMIGYVVSVFRAGPVEGFYGIAKTIGQFFTVDLPGTSFRRIAAIARLAIKEAIRRRVLTVVGLFIIALMFAGWFIQDNATHRARLFIVIVMSGTNYLILLLGFFLSAFSLPEEIKSKQIYSIVTKPVRPTEIFMGRVLGFGLVGTVLLFILGILGYVFVVRGLDHTHDIDEVVESGLSGETALGGGHLHKFEVAKDGEGITSMYSDHVHTVTRIGEGDDLRFEVGEPRGELGARIPIYGGLTFLDESGNPTGGKSVGYENEYRKYIAGGTLESAVWEFNGVTADNFPDGLKLETELYAFRTYKGDIVTGVRGAIYLRSPDGLVESERYEFEINEGNLDQRVIPVDLRGFKEGLPEDLNLFADLTQEGKIEVVVRCLDQGQYFGMARGDMTLRAGNRSFAWNFFKGYLGIWMQLMLVICFGVMYSTFLSGPVAMVATICTIGLGFFGGMFAEIIDNRLQGGGPLEAMLRISTQAGVVTEFDLGNRTVEETIQMIDAPIIRSLAVLTAGLPNFSDFNFSNFVAYQINIFPDLVLRHLFIGFGYFLLTLIVGYFFLKTREMAA